ncbi:uncharacterized protein LOC115794566 isoform X1 [Archocentrus centrarchus]|uniref:uncharacterized protein LOC115794566 isoform X1 n=1 Tax=Archocentrus centrarchus TaxID=63155 RepID=UPI0011E9F384|nr:uncharacterized protein LOC115794566 isoform X1 [Archocentrus centrarchus]
MNLVKNRTLHPHLREEEALVVENAIRLAIDSVMNVLYGVNSAKTYEYERMVADRDKEIQRLECRLTEMERELQVLRRQGCTCGLLANEHSLGGSRSSGDRQKENQSGFDPGFVDAELTAGQQECEASLSLGLFARPPSHVSSHSHESALPSSPSRMLLDQSCTSRSSEVSAVTEAARNMPTPPSSLVVKEEPCDVDAVLIKWEMSEHQQRAGSPGRESPGVKKKLENGEGRTFREKPQAEPGGFIITEGEHMRNKKKSVPMCELPEEAQRLKRAAWRAASRRYYARKIARQQANPSQSGPFPHIINSQYSQPSSLVDKRRRTLISELPEESQTLQREAWRAASRRYYARKIARHQTETAPYRNLLENINPPGDSQGPNREGAHTNSGGIMCS